MSQLNLEILKKGLTGISPTTGKFLLELIKIASLKNGHQSGVNLVVEGDYKLKVFLIWQDDLTEEIMNSWNNTRELSNFAAVGLSLLMIQHLTDFCSFEQSDIGTGIDFWMSKRKIQKGEFQKKKMN